MRHSEMILQITLKAIDKGLISLTATNFDTPEQQAESTANNAKQIADFIRTLNDSLSTL